METLKKVFEGMNDSNNEEDITKAGIWDLCDALSAKDNSKFTVEEAQNEMNRRGM